MMKTPARVLVVALALASAACPKDTVTPIGIAALSVVPDTASVVLGNNRQLVAIGYDSAGVPILGVPVTWQSSAAAVADVDGDGLVTAATLGNATITATHGTLTATTQITVVPAPVITLTPSTVTFNGVGGAPNPAPQTVAVTNGGGAILNGLQVTTITYGAGATGWLGTVLDSATAPATLTLTANTAGIALGSYGATVDIASGVAPNSPQTVTVTLVVAAGAATQISVNGGNGQTATVNSAVTTPPSVLVHDQYNNPVAGVAVTFAVATGGGGVTGGSATTNASGIATAGSWTLGQTAGANSLTATSLGLTGSPVTFTATGTAGAATQIAVNAGNGQSATVNTAVATAPAVLVRDQFNNAVAGAAVTFAVTAGGGSVTGGGTTTNASGIATVGSWTLGTTAGANALSATAGALVTGFTATGTPDVATTIALAGGNAQTDTVAATLATAYTVRVSDQFNNGVPGTSVSWATSGGGSITPTSLTNAAGIASATRVFGTVAGPQGATATVGGLTGSPVSFTATATHGAAALLVKSAGDGQSATVDSAVAIPPAVLVTDQFGNPIAGVGVTFAVRAGGGTVSPTTPIATNALGTAAVTSWRLGPVAGADSLIASAAGLSPVIFNATAISGAAQNLVLISGDAQSDTIEANLVPYVVKVTDINGNGVQGVGVSWQVTGGGGTITLNSTSDVNGFASATRTLGLTAGPASAQASVGGLNGSPQTFNATVLVGNPAFLLKNAGDGQTATVNTAVGTAPQALVTDRGGNPLAGVTVTFTLASGGGSTFPASPAGIATDGSGLATLTSWTLGTTAGSNTLDAGAAGTGTQTFSATGTPDVVSASQSSVVDGAASVTACSASCTVVGGTADSVTVTVRDQFANVIAGASVTVGSTGANNIFAPSAVGTTNGSGQFGTRLSSTFAEAKTISAVAGPSATLITQTAAVTVDPGPPSLTFSSITRSNDPITACQASCSTGAGTGSVLTVTARDAFNNNISGASVTISVTFGSNNYLGGVLQNAISGSTNGSGVYAALYNSGLAQGKSFNGAITASSTTINPTTSLTVNAAAPASVSVVNSGFSARVGTGIGTLPTFIVYDAFGNTVPNVPVSYSSSNSGAFSGPSSTNAFGQATLTFWTMAGTAADDAFGRMANQVNLFAGATFGSAIDYGIYTWSGDAASIIGPFSGCQGCHYQSWDRNPNNIVGFGDQNPAGYTSCSGYFLVLAGNANSSLIYLKTAGSLVGGVAPCGSTMPSSSGLDAATRKILRAWINNGALNN